MNFTHLVNKSISILIPRVHATNLHSAVLVNSDPAGLWVQSDMLATAIRNNTPGSTSAGKVILFVPFSFAADFYKLLVELASSLPVAPTFLKYTFPAKRRSTYSSEPSFKFSDGNAAAASCAETSS